ncbi:hypothetical protein SLINC_5470 [Streptomyces lincolnensis]|uniref:Uncharacterized protein n=1 Tax=Streptomyces lincolnensis TaxID=1915 RepID=A0A1B1MGK4_STRLN|nr:DUF6002 family protein [Streptomyces lincolnensis]ANS67694.1 hypothetical protein SLINC_5470 [Streptomyces lincolnensis]AXG55009.1 hypothetical protein SLCG_3854 [Streptomyces lincolnensis]QMV09357.1 hypothetical protein GJU35_29395 [Streptomyces lincolnensis]
MTSAIGLRSGVRQFDAPYAEYAERLRRAMKTVAASRAPQDRFEPGYELPSPDSRLQRFFAAAAIRVSDLGSYRGRQLRLLDLMSNPATRTTKTLASLLMVARAVQHIRTTAEPVMIVTPSSANKATALRDAVARAIDCGLVTPDELQITVIVPAAARRKLWASPLSGSPELARRNPVLTHDGSERSAVKELAQEFTDGWYASPPQGVRHRLWYTLDLDNYRVADTIRAFVEHDALPAPLPGGRLHAHAVSSAYGLLGHHFGHQMLREEGLADDPPHYFLVQHLDTPDMVLSLHFGSVSRENLPEYSRAPGGLLTQSADPRFPQTTKALDECLEPTFYTRAPVTSAEMNRLIRTHGGGGIVVSGHECLTRYREIRRLTARAGLTLPSDPAELREWSLVMAFTGVLYAIDRGLVAEEDIVVHGSGSYSAADFVPLPMRLQRQVGDADEVRTAVLESLS